MNSRWQQPITSIPTRPITSTIAATKDVSILRSAATQVDGASASGWSFSTGSYQDSDGDWEASTGALTMELHGTIKLPPGAPTGLTATEGHHAVKLEWTPPAAVGISPITGYEYTIDEGATFVATGSTGRSLILDNLADNNLALRVRAVNAVGKGEWSPAVIATIGPASVIIVGYVASETIEGALCCVHP